MKALEQELGIKVGETTKDKMFTLVEVECAGACANAPMFVINDHYFEDLTEEVATKLIRDIRAGRTPKTGPQSSRKSCEPLSGKTSLLQPPPAPELFTRKDL